MKTPLARAVVAALAPALPAAVLSYPSLVHAATAAPETALTPVVVSASRAEQPITDVVADVTVIDRETIERSGAVAIADVLARVPGIAISRNGGPGTTTNVFLRGADGRFTAVFIDGVRVDSQSTGGATWNAIALSQVERIEVLRGPAAALYGSDAVAGVVQIFTRRGEPGFYPEVRLGLGSDDTRSLGAWLRGGGDGFDYALGVNGERSDGFNARLLGNPDRDGYQRDSASARLGWRAAPGHRVELSASATTLHAGYDGFTPGQDDQSYHRLQTLGLQWTADWSSDWRTRLGLTRGTDVYQTRPSPYRTQTRVDTLWLRNEWRLPVGVATVDWERREDALTNVSTTPADTRRHQNALALGYRLRHGAHTLQLNARHDDDSEFGGQTTGQIAYGFDLTHAWRLTASAGTAFRVPTLFQRFSIYGTPDLKAESARTAELGARWHSGADRLSVVAYRSRVRNLIDYVSGPGPCANGTGAYPGCYANVGRARLSGIGVSGGTRLGAVNLSASWDVMQPLNTVTDKRLPRRPRTQAMLTADTTLQGWRLGGELQRVGNRFDNAANTQRLSAYTLLNLSAERSLARDWRLQLRLDNVTDRDYQLARGYATAGRTVFVALVWTPH